MKINKNIAKGCIPNVSEEVFVMKKVKKYFTIDIRCQRS